VRVAKAEVEEILISMTESRTLETVPEVPEVACVAEEGSMMCMLLWFEMLIFVALEKDIFRVPSVIVVGPSVDLESVSVSTCPLLGVWGIVNGVVAKEEALEEKLLLGWRRRLFAASSAASLMEIAEAFFFLKENLGFGAA